MGWDGLTGPQDTIAHVMTRLDPSGNPASVGPNYPAVMVIGRQRVEHLTFSGKKVRCKYLAFPIWPSESASSSEAQRNWKTDNEQMPTAT